MSEKPGDVFAALLRAWRAGESQIISEWGVNASAEEAAADEETKRWAERFEKAMNGA